MPSRRPVWRPRSVSALGRAAALPERMAGLLFMLLGTAFGLVDWNRGSPVSLWLPGTIELSMLSTLGEIIRDLLLVVGLITVLLVGLILAVMMMPAGNPLKRVLTALCFRLGATAAAAVFGNSDRAHPRP
jgi:hypothetical protein